MGGHSAALNEVSNKGVKHVKQKLFQIKLNQAQSYRQQSRFQKQNTGYAYHELSLAV